jgi:short-subunit dehydrogenase
VSARVHWEIRDGETEVLSYHDGKVVAVTLDVTDLEAIQSLRTKYLDVTLVVNNTGFRAGTPSLDSIAMAQKEITTNYIIPLAVVKFLRRFSTRARAPRALMRPRPRSGLKSDTKAVERQMAKADPKAVT